MTAYDLAVRAERMITPAGEVSGWVGVRDGRIAAVQPLTTDLTADRIVRLAADEVLLPGLVDTHVHVNDPGRADWEGFPTATRAAAAGGITTIVDMPLNSLPPTVTVDALAVKRAAARGRVFVDVGFWGGAVPANLGALAELHRAGVFGFKSFLLHSGVDEFGWLDRDQLTEAMRVLAEVDALLIVHAEDAHTIEHAPAPVGRRYADFLASRPPAAEHAAVASVLELAERFGTRVHVLHLASGALSESIVDARARGVRVTVETCPHYLSFCAEEIPDGATQFKCCPPIREAANREDLWRGLAEGAIDCVVSDHSPCTADLKRFDVGDFGLAWGGIAGLQVGLSAVWTQARQRGHTLADVVTWMATRPADLVGLADKGRIEVGRDADLCVFAPDETFLVDAAKLFHRNAVSAYHGRPLAGVVRRTWLRGGLITRDRPAGRLLTRGEA
ncbi:MAG TPA: allantoinase AllB [Pseudonocardiaceae bacterium]|jgi:allantoinase|nr:allantoinase AllB [Pseudonocardiaceae bacterium]